MKQGWLSCRLDLELLLLGLFFLFLAGFAGWI